MSRTQREMKALRQQQREEAAARQRSRERRNLFIIGGILAIAALAILIVALALNHAAQNRLTFQTVNTLVGQQIADEGPATHVPVTQTLTYKFYPPTSGPHYGQPDGPVPWQTIGNASSPLAEGQFVHNLEHGGITILYNCASGNDCTTLQDQLENYVRNLAPIEPNFGEVKMVITPYSKGMTKKVALVAWHYVEFLDAYDQNAITQFYESHVDKGPEPIA